MVRFFISFAVVFLLVSGKVCAQFEDGSGTLADPYQISTIEQLQQVQNYPDAYFVQVEHINARATKSWNEGKGFQPISNFTGNYDGASYSINEMFINRPEQKYTAIFAYVDGGAIKNLIIKKAQITGADNTGILAGFSINGRIDNVRIHESKLIGHTYTGGLVGFNFGNISNSSVSATISGYSYIGGLVGFNRGKINTSSTEGSVSGTGNGVGGMIGNNYDGELTTSSSKMEVTGLTATSFGGLIGSNGGTVSKSYASGNVNGRSYVGGLIGFNRGEISEAYATGNVNGSKNGVGGLIGNNYEGNVKQVYSTGKVEGVTQVGGLIGVNRSKTVVNIAYTVSHVIGNNDVGGLMGLNETPVKFSYWNAETARQKNAVGRGHSEGITALNTEEMSGTNVQQKMKGFAFNVIWGSIPDEYPKLLWNRPYFVIGEIEGSKSIISGDMLDLKVSVKNVGGIPDTNNVILRDHNGRVIHISNDLILQSDQEIMLEFGWQSTADDKGEHEFLLQSNHDQEVIHFEVKRIPDIVDITEPGNLDEQISLKPQFKWREAYLAETYQLQIARDINFEQILLNKNGIKDQMFTIPESLDYLNNYFWRVRGENEEDMGEWSQIFHFTTIIEKPEIILLPEPEKTEEIYSTLPTLTWHSASRADEYFLEVATDDEYEHIVFDSTFSSPDTSFIFERELNDETEYFWRVQAKNAGGNSDWSKNGVFFTNRNLLQQEDIKPTDFSLKQNYPNPFNSSTNIEFGLPQSSYVILEVLNMLGQNVATLVSEPKSAGWHTIHFDASDLSSGFYLYRIKTRNFEQTKKLMLIK